MVDDDLTLRMLVPPLTAVSMGNETRRSTSSAAIPLASVITTTVGAFRSGNTSTSMLLAVYSPLMRSSMAATITVMRLLSENLMILLSITFVINVNDYDHGREWQ